MNVEIPDKRYFKISEVGSISGLESHVLRFWESEFGQIRPKRTDSGQRMYRKKDVEFILEVKELLHERKFTIKGAKQHIKDMGKRKSEVSGIDPLEIIRDLEAIKALLG